LIRNDLTVSVAQNRPTVRTINRNDINSDISLTKASSSAKKGTEKDEASEPDYSLKVDDADTEVAQIKRGPKSPKPW